MVAAFAPALCSLGGCVSEILVAAASGVCQGLVRPNEMLRIAVSRSAVCVLSVIRGDNLCGGGANHVNSGVKNLTHSSERAKHCVMLQYMSRKGKIRQTKYGLSGNRKR